MKKEARAAEKAILANIPRLRAKIQAYSSVWPMLPALWATWQPGKTDRPKELAWRAEKVLPGEGISRENLEAAGASGRK